MRGVSLRLKINLAILLAFVAAALAFGAVLRLYLADRLALAQDRTRVLLAAVAAHRLEALIPLLEQGQPPKAIQDILDHLTLVKSISEASLFDADGTLLAQAGQGQAAPLVSGEIAARPTGRVYAVSSEHDRLRATLVEPVLGQAGLLGFLRLRYSLASIQDLNQRLWLIFALALASAYGLMAGLLNLLLHRFVLRPVNTLRQALESVEVGSLEATVPVHSRDALGRLATAFNAMSARLRETSLCLGDSRAEVEEQHRLLETRVAMRTAELAEANARLVDEIEGRRRAENSLRQALAQRDALLGNSQVGLATLRDRMFVDINPRGAAILGYAREALLGRSARLLFTDEDDFLAAARDIESQFSSQGPICLERRLRRGDGAIIWARLHGKLVTEGGANQDVVWAFDDITQEKEHQDRLERGRLEAEKASRAKGAFLAVMSHEIRTPLNVILGLTDLLLDRDATVEQRGYLRTVKDSATHLAGVINDILDFSKIEAGKLVLERVDFSLPGLIDAVARAMNVQARQKGLAFSATVAEDVPRVLRGDPGRLRQVLVNLLGNAVKFTDAGCVRLAVDRAGPEAASTGRIGLTFRVEDTGIGIAPDRLSNLFTSFQQGSGSAARRFGGSGLGLAISKELVERMGGGITVRSSPGQGSVFSCLVFLAPGDPARETALREPGLDVGQHLPARPCLRILLVEDNALNAAVARLHLERMHHSLTVANSAREAYAQLSRQRFDAVLMDIEMPEIDGITATRAIRAGGPADAPGLDPAVPIVAVTAHAVEDVRSQCLEAGMNGFITKPVNYHALESVLDNLGRRPAATGSAPAAPKPSGLFDPEAARASMGISWEQYGELSQVSFREGRGRLDEVRLAMAAGDFERAGIAAHTFKGAAATLGAYSCRDMAVTLERAVRAGETEQAREVLDRIVAAWEAVGQAQAAWQAPGDDQEP
jgi:PAS domain S-box-containing protein